MTNERSPLLYSMLDVVRDYRSESLQRPARRATGAKAFIVKILIPTLRKDDSFLTTKESSFLNETILSKFDLKIIA